MYRYNNIKSVLGPFLQCPVTLTVNISVVLPIEFCRIVLRPDIVRTALNDCHQFCTTAENYTYKSIAITILYLYNRRLSLPDTEMTSLSPNKCFCTLDSLVVGSGEAGPYNIDRMIGIGTCNDKMYYYILIDFG